MRQWLGLLVLIPFLTGFEVSRAREALDLAYHNLYGADVLAGVELVVRESGHEETWTAFAYGRKRKGAETRTLVYTGDGKRNSPRALLFQRPGERDRIFVSDGSRGQVRPMSAGEHRWPMFGSAFSYEDFRAHTAADYRIEVLGTDRIKGEHCRVLRLRPFDGPYAYQLIWLSTSRPVILRSDYFDSKGLWKRYSASPQHVVQHFEWWVPMEDHMVDLRTGRQTTRHIRNLLIDTAVPDEIFTLTQFSRGRLPNF